MYAIENVKHHSSGSTYCGQDKAVFKNVPYVTNVKHLCRVARKNTHIIFKHSDIMISMAQIERKNVGQNTGKSFT